MQQPITGYFQDEENHWVAKLACGHNQHVRHNPPLVSRPWVLTQAGRDGKIGVMLNCKKCRDDGQGAPADRVARRVFIL